MSTSRQLRAWLILGRVSNLPTVWSNCIAGYWLGGGGSLGTLAVLCLAATLLYVGGMFLNDVCDVAFDREFRPERPIISGHVTCAFALTSAVAMLTGGTLLLAFINATTLAYGCALGTAIVLYDLVHKRTAAAPLIMGVCRLLLFLAAASAGALGVNERVLLSAVALAFYIAGLSYVARGESSGARMLRIWPWLMLVAPLMVALAWNASRAALVLALPLVACLAFAAVLLRRRQIARAVALFLAGIVFVDLLAIASSSIEIVVGYLVLFGVTLLSQRYVPAT